MQERIEQPTARVLTSDQTHFKLIAKAHKFIDFTYDTLLF